MILIVFFVDVLRRKCEIKKEDIREK